MFLLLWQGREWGRLFTSGFLHGDDSHLYYNMVSLLWKVRGPLTKHHEGVL
jgi:membrane associated rhomboid family serine protease